MGFGYPVKNTNTIPRFANRGDYCGDVNPTKIKDSHYKKMEVQVLTDEVKIIMTSSEFQPVPSYIPSEDMGKKDTIPKRLFDVRSMRLVETANIIDKDRLKYVAISYSWNEKYRVDLQDPNIFWEVRFATPNWLFAVCEKVKEIQMNYIWLDALCINQNSKEDKELQVPLMGDYYHGAEMVMVILDDIEQYKNNVLSSLEELNKIPYDIEDDSKFSSVPDWLKLEHFLSANTLIAAISKSRWTKRIWTVQEIRLSKKSIYFIPGIASLTDMQLSTISMLKYMGASSQIEEITKHMVDLRLDIQVTDSLSVESIIPNKKKRYLSIAEAQQLLIGRSCKLEQDNVYGMLGLLRYGSHLKADYNLTLEEIEKKLYTLASENGDYTWISGNGERHLHCGWSMAMKSGGTPILCHFPLFSAPKISNNTIEIAGLMGGEWCYIKELTPLQKPDPDAREAAITRTCTSIITAISMRSKNLESCKNALKAGFYLYDDEADSILASIINRNEIFNGWKDRFVSSGIGRWSKTKIKGKDQGALFASVVTRIYAWYRFEKRLSLIEINTNGKDKNYRAVASLDQNQTSGEIMVIGLVSKEISVCIPVIKAKEKFMRVGGIILIPFNEMNEKIFREGVFPML